MRLYLEHLCVDHLLLKEVKYYENTFVVPLWVSFIVLDKDGSIVGFEESPTIEGDSVFWVSPNCKPSINIGKFILPSSFDWKQSCVSVKA